MKNCVCRVAAIAALVVAASTSVSHAQLAPPTIFVGDLHLPASGAPQMVGVDVFFDTDNPMSIPIEGFQLELSLIGPDHAVTFAGVIAPQNHPYIFDPDSAAPLFSISGDGLTVTLGDFLDTGFGNIADGVGLAGLKFLVQPEAAGKSYAVKINTDPSVSFLAADSMTFVPFTPRDGTIDVVPEPATITIALFLVLAGLRRRARA